MTSNAINPIGYAAAADAYLQAGWIGVLPLEPRTKWPPPPFHKTDSSPSYTGYAGIDPSYPDIAAWSEDHPNGNLCLRLPNNDTIAVIGIDIDNYGAKTGGATYAEATRRWGTLPEAPRSSSREGNPVSGIRLFQIPPGTRLATRIVFPELGLGDIEIIQWHHRYVVAWPSIHPEGHGYWWRNDADQLIGIPSPTELPWLPQEWIDGLKVENESNLGNTPIEIQSTLTEGDPSFMVRNRLTQAIKELNLPGQSRHDTTCRHTLALMRLGKSGELGVKRALQMLCEVFVAVTSADGSRTPEVARAEFLRMITNSNAARELANPSGDEWIRALILPDVDPPTEHIPTTKSRLEEIEQGFWDSRESLRMIYQTAMSRMCPPWAVLAHVAARALAQVRPHVTLPPLIGGPGSLNWFAAVVAKSGGGKGASSSCARLLIPGHVESRNVGSGEGIVAAYGRPADDGDPSPVHESLMFSADEVDTLAAMNQRTASTTLSILRSGFSGETLGFSYAAREKRRHIGAHTYRMTLVVSMQPTRAGWLLADKGGGTPQRFMWFPGADSRISKKRPWESGPLTLPPLTEWQYPRTVTVPEQAAELILDERVKAMQGDQAALDGHALFCREKFAYALAVLDGRVNMTLEDWKLSGIAMLVSDYVRELTVDNVKDAARIEALDRGEIRGLEMTAAEEAKALEEAERTRRVLRWLLDKLEDADETGLTNRELTQRAASRDRKWLGSALSIAQSNGLIKLLDSGVWVKI